MTRADANQLSLRVAAGVLAGAEAISVDVGGVTVQVDVDLIAQDPWPRDNMLGLDEARDGPWPRALKLRCTWPGGAVDLRMEASFWRRKNAERHQVAIALTIFGSPRQLVWITLPRQLAKAADGDVVHVGASVAMVKRGETTKGMPGWARALKELVADSGLPMRSGSFVEVFQVRVPECEILPSASVAFRRLVRVALLKLDFFDSANSRARGMLVDVAKLAQAVGATASRDEDEAEDGPEQDDGDDGDDGEAVDASARRYWAGGFSWGAESQLDAFVAGNYWQIGWERDAPRQAAKTTWRRFEDVKIGDWFAIKGYGGQHDLVVHYVGEVRGRDDERGRLELEPLSVARYRGKAPRGAGAGSWFDTLVPVRQREAIADIFGVRVDSVTEGRAPAYPALNLVLYGPPGTGKTYRIQDHYQRLFTRVATSEGRAREELAAEPARASHDYAFVTFHQSYAYEDFVEGIRPRVDQADDEASIRYVLEDGVFKQAVRAALRLTGFEGGIHEFCGLSREARRAQLEGAPHYALFIDELNRGNVANVLGELITLLEEDKRLGCDNEVIVTLPYSKTRFGVPANLHLIASMNTADRSIEALDAALRRRFEFVECMPRYETLNFEITGGIDPARMLRAINERIHKLRDRDHMIGHAYLMALEQDPSLEALKRCFGRKIIPLLQEYFFSDWGQIALVLGDDFVRPVDRRVRFASAAHHDLQALEERPVYELTKLDDLTSVSFRKIYEHVSEDD